MKKLFFFAASLLAVTNVTQAVKLNVEVPEGTKQCFVCGNFNGWDVETAPELQVSSLSTFSIDMPDVTFEQMAEGYKYLCGRDWLYVEKDEDGEEISNRTTPGNPDVVGSWRSVPEYGVETADITINGIPRQLKIYLPEGYEDSSDAYPVIYYNTVQQRYSNAGDDNDNGDYFFGRFSWNAHETMENLRKEGGNPYIMVQICSMLAENTVEENPDYKGTGSAPEFLEAFINDLIPFIESNWRIKSGKDNTIIMGADYGALFSLYAALNHPEIFGKSVAMSPMLWINDGVFESLAVLATPGQSYYVSAGSREPAWMIDSSRELTEKIASVQGVNAYFSLFEGASHNDDSWGECFPAILKGMDQNSAPEINSVSIASISRQTNISALNDTEFSTGIYTLFGGDDSGNLQKLGRLSYTQDFRKNSSEVPCEAQVFTATISVSYQGQYYWNIAKGESAADGWLMEENKSIGFSNKKTEASWFNVAVFPDGTIADIAAHSKGFTVKTSSGSTPMNMAGEYYATATLSFPTDDKNFEVHFGSVNSATDMGSITPSLSVSETCIEADLLYDFNLNKVTVTETKHGEVAEVPKVRSFSAVPAVATTIDKVDLTVELNKDCNINVNCKNTSGNTINTNVNKIGNGQFNFSLNQLPEGIYTITVDIDDNGSLTKDAASINLRVLPASQKMEKELRVNAYENIDWDKTGRYKANFHTHTSQSFDTQYTTTEVVDKYQKAGYKILALTDHDANPYPWSMFNLYNADAQDRDANAMGMLSIPGNELSKDRRNNWSEITGGEFNHHNDFFTGRKGQEFMSLRESYAYSQAIGGLQIINHPGQYWNLSTEYKAGEKNSPDWHAENFTLYPSLIGLEVYNQGNRRPNDRILWDQVLTITMPQRPVWGYSCDDTHTAEQYFRNYQYMLMRELSVEALKEAMTEGSTVFSYEYTGSGKAKAPSINSIKVDKNSKTITIDSEDYDTIEWIYSTYRTGTAASTTKSCIVGYGNTFNFEGYQGSYVRARLINKYGETAIQPFGFVSTAPASVIEINKEQEKGLRVIHNPGEDKVTLICTEEMIRISVVNAAGNIVRFIECDPANSVDFNVTELNKGVYVIVVATEKAAYTGKFLR